MKHKTDFFLVFTGLTQQNRITKLTVDQDFVKEDKNELLNWCLCINLIADAFLIFR